MNQMRKHIAANLYGLCSRYDKFYDRIKSMRSIDKTGHRKFTGSLHGIFLFLFPDCGMIPLDLF